jgi:hypothetical protein
MADLRCHGAAVFPEDTGKRSVKWDTTPWGRRTENFKGHNKSLLKPRDLNGMLAETIPETDPREMYPLLENTDVANLDFF